MASDSDNEELDPRIQDELESLNCATDDINRLEKEVDEANAAFRAQLTDSTTQLGVLAKKLGSCVINARPYYDARKTALRAHTECQESALRFQRAHSAREAAKQTMALAEQRFSSRKSDCEFDSTWQEVLNQATCQVIDAEKQKALVQEEHHQRAEQYRDAEQQVKLLERRFAKDIAKSRSYFEQKDNFDRQLQLQKEKVERLQLAVRKVKLKYAQSLTNLETISEEIHERRNLLQPREPGVGAEELDVDFGKSEQEHSKDLYHETAFVENLKAESVVDGGAREECASV